MFQDHFYSDPGHGSGYSVIESNIVEGVEDNEGILHEHEPQDDIIRQAGGPDLLRRLCQCTSTTKGNLWVIMIALACYHN